MLNHQNYKMAAGGAGVIAYKKGEGQQAFVLLSERSEKVGAGLGITGGGFVECDEVNNQPPGYVLPLTHEAWREAVEENPGFEKIISRESFDERATYLTAFAVSTNDQHGVHLVCYFGLELSDAEFLAVQALPPSDERIGALIPAKLSWTRESLKKEALKEKINLEGMNKFYHQHELYAFLALTKKLESITK